MAFTGTPVITQISDSIVRITGVSLAAGAAGIIGLHGSTVSGAVKLPRAFQPKPYEYETHPIPMADSVDVSVKPAAVGVATAIPFAVVKTGTTEQDFVATITNTHASLATPNLEIYVKFHE